jgi:hypothetical protein|tara:strand:- start:145 stop:309 length:165 start_codon:yes stop_codon:yes gene_type:complete
MKIKTFFNGMYEFAKKAFSRATSIMSDPMNTRAIVAIIVLTGFVILAMSFGIIK